MLIAQGELFSNGQLTRMDTFRTSIPKKYDIILANPPYGGDKVTKKGKDKKDNKTATDYNKACKEIHEFGVKSNVKELLFLQMIMQNLKEGGRACVVLPEGLFGNLAIHAYAETRKNLVEHFNVKQIGISNGNEFENALGVKTCIINFEKKGKTENVLFTDLSGNIICNASINTIINNNYILLPTVYSIIDCVKPIKSFEIVSLENVIKILPRSPRNSNDGSLFGNYRFYTVSKGTNLYSEFNDFKMKSLLVTGTCTYKMYLDKNYSCNHIYHNCVNIKDDIPIEWIYYYLQQNNFLVKNLYMGTIMKTLIENVLN